MKTNLKQIDLRLRLIFNKLKINLIMRYDGDDDVVIIIVIETDDKSKFSVIRRSPKSK